MRTRDRRGASLAVGVSIVGHLALLIALPIVSGGPTRPRLTAPAWLIELARPVEGENLTLLLAPADPADVAPAPPPSDAPVVVELPSLVEPAPAPPPPAPERDAPSAFAGREAPTEQPGPAQPAGAAGARGPGVPLSVAERLQPGEKDPRLWYILPEEIVGLSQEQRAELELALAIAAIGDSAAVAAAAQARATDWTYTDSEGRRWGFSPGQLHLGDITIPLPFGFEPPPNTLAARRAREDAEIATQAARQEVRSTLRDRAAEIRRRRDAERTRSRGDTATVIVDR